MMMKSKLLLYALGLLLITNTGCEKFLDVTPKSSVAEEELFSSEAGFQQALSGVYSQLAERELYADNLSMGFVSALAQNYSARGAQRFIFKETTALNYDTDEVRARTESIWSRSYTAIAGLNNILAHIEGAESIFTGSNYALIKGEALALRAYLHFELFRLFAPTVRLAPTAKAIPYRKEMTAANQEYDTVTNFISLALEDLAESAELLDKIDPIKGTDRQRRFKMNYLAVRALAARINLYAGNNLKAGADAQAVINSGKLAFVKSSEISTSAASKDRLFSNEQIFAVRVRTMKDWTDDSYFRFRSNSDENLTQSDANFAALFETVAGGSTDYRFVYLLEFDQSVRFPSKFWQTWSVPGGVETARLDQTVPLLRLSEMYYIAAETAADPKEGTAFLNQVRKNRGLSELNVDVATEMTLANEIAKEYRKEFYAEGQLFFFYKRLNFSRMQFGSATLNSSRYILPLPNSETEFSGQND